MAESTKDRVSRRGSRWRIVVWGSAAFLLLLPLIAMQLTDEVTWGAADFILMGAMLAAACGACELAAWVSGDGTYRAAFGVAIGAAFLLVWMNLAVGLIGDEGNPANLMFGGVLAVGALGAVLARFQPQGMARTLVATALAQTSAGVIALIAGWGDTVDTIGLTGLFTALWIASAWLFLKAARGHAPAGAAAYR